ncbi:mitochondrial import inner membrane translocase subunit TIM23-1-like, partial [Phalaenopsis equestris]
MADLGSFGYSGGDNPDNRQQPGRRIYDPYKDLQIPYRAIYDIPTSPEFLFQEESVAQRRSWGENLTYYTGIGYLGGAVGGASIGLYKGLRS